MEWRCGSCSYEPNPAEAPECTVCGEQKQVNGVAVGADESTKIEQERAVQADLVAAQKRCAVCCGIG